MKDFQNLQIWQSTDLRGRLPWYRQVATNQMPAKFCIAQHIPVEISLADADEESLWQMLEEKTPAFLGLCERIKEDAVDLAASVKPQPNLVGLCRELTQRMLRHCNFCRWNCRVDRTKGTKFGTCKLADDSRVSSYFHHRGEELIYRGQQGSGTIFFTSCNMRCHFCQNGDISTDKDNGQVVSPRTLATMAWLLRMEGCHNINWVGGEVTIHLHTIVEAISLLDELCPTDQDLWRAFPAKADHHEGHRLKPENGLYQGAFNAPMLWNSNFFMSDQAMKILRVLIDVWLPDFKFGPGKCAVALSRTPWYWETVTGNLKMIYDWGEDFTIRHLVMPGHVDCCTRSVLEWIAENMPDVPVNVMDQYHPDNYCDPRSPKFDPKYAELSRRTTDEEVLRAFHYGRELGLRFESLSYETSSTGLSL
jgi:putative pyruvate formate lyase activating enzyme